MQYPIIHSNGTSPDRLLEDIENAYKKIREAVEELALCAPNGRDYYPLGPEAIRKAEDEHKSRVNRLLSVLLELEDLGENIFLQKERQNRNRR